MCGAVKLTDLCENDWEGAFFGLYRYGIKNIKSTIPANANKPPRAPKMLTIKVSILQSVQASNATIDPVSGSSTERPFHH